ncbi:MAG: mannonate dehydratase [Brevinemataceae bacterium]
MYMTFRWYGPNDPISLNYIRQIPCVKGIVSSLHDEPTGSVWDFEKITAYKKNIESYGLNFKVIESVPVHEDIKLGKGSRDQYIEHYIQTLKNLARAGLEVITYNFMPVFDWTRTSLDTPFPDGSNALTYKHKDILAMDPTSPNLTLPAWVKYSHQELINLLEDYKSVDTEKLWSNLEYFLKAVIPVAKENDLKMAIHPDDPPWSIFGLPRIITNKHALERVLSIVDTPVNGLCFCTGSLGIAPENDCVDMVKTFAGQKRIHFAHCRNVRIDGDKDFSETAHPKAYGDIDFTKILKAYYDAGFDGPVRPDHGRMIWGETGLPGYGLYDRALGAVYLQGIWDMLDSH